MAARGAFLLPRAGSDRFAAEGEAAWRLLARDRLLRLEVPDRSGDAHALRLHQRDGGDQARQPRLGPVGELPRASPLRCEGDQAGEGPPLEQDRVGVGEWTGLLAARHALNPPRGAW